MVNRTRRWALALLLGAVALLAACGGGGAPGGTPTKEPIKIGDFYDGSGPTANYGVPARQGIEDYIKLVNKKGGVDGHPVQVTYIDMAYEVPRGVEGYERLKREGVVGIIMWATPLVLALTERGKVDQIPMIHPGFGAGAAVLGESFPYNFPMAASYRTQAVNAVKFILDQWQKEGRPGKPKIAFLAIDNPAGREPLGVLEELQRREGFELRTFFVPLPGTDASAQATDIVRRYQADWTIWHLFGLGGGAAARAWKELGAPLNRVVALFPSSGTEEYDGLGGLPAVEGLYGTQIFNFGPDVPLARELKQIYQDEGRAPSDLIDRSRWYWFGVFKAALMVAGLRQALEKESWPLTGEKVKRGLESVRGNVDGVVSVNMSPQDHEGGGQVRVYQVRQGRWQPATDWFTAYRDIIIEVARREVGAR